MEKYETKEKLVETKVMGRAAVVWVVAAIQPISYAQLFGLAEASESVRQIAETNILPYLWSSIAVFAGLCMLASILAKSPEVERVWEIAANLLVCVISLFFAYAAFKAVGFLSGGGWAISISVALAGSCFGRAWLLVKQILWVNRRCLE